MESSSARISRFLPLAPLALALALIVSSSRPVAAGCFNGLESCYFAAALYSSWVDMWVAGLDCEVEFTSCMRRALIGR
jgi:hypothetical protein